jgi:NSS family neurotransmitter:Na+ symporter
MAELRQSIHGQWSSRWAFIMAATGSAVGLGNIWKFPYMAGQNGGGAFVLIYLLCVVAVGVPIMMAEILAGRRGRQSPINTVRTLAMEAGHSRWWQLIGWGGIVAGFLIMSFYSVVAGWACAYLFKAVLGTLATTPREQIPAIFDELLSSPATLLFWHTLFTIMTVILVARGVRSGLEQGVRWLMPLLMLLLVMLVGYAMSTTGFMQGVAFLFQPDFSQITTEGVLKAMGHSFFTLSLGMGAIMMYGSYLPQDTSIAKATISIAVADTVAAVLAGLAIFPIVFSNGLEASGGPGLVFKTLPIAFSMMPAGSFFAALFFLLLVFAAWTSAISIIEPAVAWLVENHGFKRVRAAWLVGTATWLMGIGSLLSFNLWSGATLFGKTFFDIVDFIASNVMLPLGGLLIAIFVGWIMRRRDVAEELGMASPRAFAMWYAVLRFASPILVMLLFLYAVGVIQFDAA